MITMKKIQRVGVAVTFLTNIRAVLDSNLGEDTGFPEFFWGGGY
jgi:hypothetical protein